MADEQAAVPEGGDELILTPEQQVEETPQDDAPDPIADLATEMGWSPKEQYKGDPEKWRDAGEFIRAGHDIQRSTAKELKAMRSTVDTIAKTSASLFEQQMAEERRKLTAQYEAAVEDGDTAGSFRIAQDIGKLETPQARQQPAPEAQEWAASNKWFDADPVARQRAIEVGEIYNKNGASTAEQLAAAERVVRKEFPEHFPQAKRPAQVHSSSRATGQSSGKKGFADLPPEAQKVARSFLDTNGIPLDTYATNYFATERKVG